MGAMELQELKNIFNDPAVQGVSREVSGNKPLLLDEPSKVWLVQTGRVDVFFIQIKEGGARGARHHVFRAEEGDLLFGLKPAPDTAKSGLIAVGMVGTTLLEIDRDQLTSHFDGSSRASLLEDLVGSWINNLCSGLIRVVELPKNPRALEKKTEESFEAGEALHSNGDFIWGQPVSGSFYPWGRLDHSPLPPDSLFPLPVGNNWLMSGDKAVISIKTASEAIADDPGLSFMDQFHQLVLDYYSLAAEKSKNQDRESLRRSNRADRMQLENAVAGLATVMDKETGAMGLESERDDHLLAACRAVGRAMGVRIKAPGPGQDEAADRLGSIARASRFRIREVYLQGSWRLGDNGPLLGFFKEDGRPVALLPVNNRKYEIFDPVRSEKRPLTAEEADKIDSRAWCFYRPLPERALTGTDLLGFALQGSGRDLWTIVLMGIIGGLLGLLTPLMTGILFDSVIPSASAGQLVQIAAVLAACALAAAVFEITKGFAVVRLEGKMDASVQAALWDRLLALPLPFFRQFSSGDLADRSLGLSAIREVLSGVAVNAILSLIFSSLYFILLFYYDPRLAFVALILTFSGLLFVSILGYAQVRHQFKIEEYEGRLSGMMLQFITGIAKLKVSGTEDRAFSQWAGIFTQKKSIDYKAGVLAGAVVSFNSVFPILTAMVIFYLVLADNSGRLTTGQFLAFNAAYISLQAALLELTRAMTSSLNVIPIYKRLKPIIETRPEVDESKASPGAIAGALELNRLNFKYGAEEPLVIDNVSLTIKAGDFAAVVGESGAGKSTLLRLLLGFESPVSGAIFYDGQDLSMLDAAAVRRQCGVVLQNGDLMHGDIFRNIVGMSGLTIDDAWDAARMVGIDKDIEKMPMGMHTIVTPRGGALSGGQRQRLMIASAIVNKPRILFFDEATSALDNKSQAVIRQSLEKLKATRVVIAHRISTIKDADRIFVLQNGRIVQTGTYEELMSREGYFRELAGRQMV